MGGGKPPVAGPPRRGPIGCGRRVAALFPKPGLETGAVKWHKPLLMEDFAPRGDLIDSDRLEQLLERSDLRGGLQLVVHLVLLIATGVAVFEAVGTPWLIPAMIPYGVVLVFLFAPLHEAIHGTAFKNRGVNETVAWLAAFVLVLPPHYFRLFHFTHHRSTQDVDYDPELLIAKPEGLIGYLWHVSGLPYWGGRLWTTLGHAATGGTDEFFIPTKARHRVVAEARVLWAGYVIAAAVSWYFDSLALVTYWIGPALLGQPFLRLFLMAEHTGCPRTDDMLESTRTTQSNFIVRALAWNMPYHTAHHLFPAVPFFALGKLNAELRDRLRAVGSGYFAFHRDLVARLRSQSPKAS